MFEYFTENALNAIIAAQKEARRLGRNHVGTEHILLGIMSDNSDIARKILLNKGLTLDKIKLEVENITGQGTEDVEPEIPFTEHAKKVLQSAENIVK